MTTHHTLGSIAVPRGMVWVDEFDWTPVEKAVEYSLTGSLLIDVGVRQAGRPITLQGSQESGWLTFTRSVLTALTAQAAAPEGEFLLTLADGRSFTVQFAPGNPIEAQPIGRPELPDDNHPYVATVRLIEV